MRSTGPSARGMTQGPPTPFQNPPLDAAGEHTKPLVHTAAWTGWEVPAGEGLQTPGFRLWDDSTCGMSWGKLAEGAGHRLGGAGAQAWLPGR